MPDPPPAKRRTRATQISDPRELSAVFYGGAGDTAPVLPPYAELHCRSNYSFLEGASHADELFAQARQLGYSALAIADRNSLAGIVRAHVAARESGVRLIVGAEIVPEDGPTMVLLPTSRAGYGRLSSLITVGRRRSEKGQCQIRMADVAEYSGDLFCCLPLSTETRQRYERRYQPGAGSELPSGTLEMIRSLFGSRCSALAELHAGPRDRERLSHWLEQCRAAELPIAAANDVHFHTPRRRALQDVVAAIRNRSALQELGHELFPNGERYLKPVDELLRVFGGRRELLERTLEIAEQCCFSLSELKYEYPEELVPAGLRPVEHLRNLTWSGAAERYPQGVPERIRGMIRHELGLIEELQYEAYFLTVYDLVRFARERGILCQGRGSAANSVVCFCLGITSVDPGRIDVLFERFVSRERNEAPDIDVDFEHERREEVLQYIFERYGRERAGMTAAVISYRPRSAIRDIGRAMALSADMVDRLAGQLEHVDSEEQLPMRLQEGGLDPESLLGRRILDLLRSLLTFPRHLSQHPGGMVMSRGPLNELVPLENAAMPGRTVIQWDKDDLDALGLLKVDCLSLGMLSCIRRAFDLVELHHQRRLTLANVPAEDPEVYDMISRADTVGVFQIESRAQMSMLPRLKPRCFYDLVIEVAIVRPGPIQGDMVHPYLRRRSGEEEVDYPNPEVRQVLHKTLGVPIFQEQAMRLAIVAAGFTPGEADQLRRAMGAWRKTGVIARFHEKLVAGMLERGYQQEFAERVFKQISGFGEYGFPESHAASFALLVYVSAWLKRHHPAVFAAALINSQPMGFYAPAQLVRDARQHGVGVLPVDVSFSDWDCTLEPSAKATPGNPYRHRDESLGLRLGLRLLRGFSEPYARQIEQARKRGGAFRSFEDFAKRTGLPRQALQVLARGDALASLKIDRRSAFWKSLPARETAPLMDARDDYDDLEPLPDLPRMSAQDEVVADYTTAGLSLRRHPVSFLRTRLNELRAVTAESLAVLEVDRRVRVAGLVLMRQRPSTAAGITFVTLEDETGAANLVIYPNVWQAFRPAARFAGVLLATGRLQREGDIIHVVCERLDDLSELLKDLDSRSRDFH
ncbi:MAG TPA: error-prone DNA polymerase [Planctomycetaceae bacterium]|nr:error-prone DNA polymerase [Planctomycetaceae bacterium]